MTMTVAEEKKKFGAKNKRQLPTRESRQCQSFLFTDVRESFVDFSRPFTSGSVFAHNADTTGDGGESIERVDEHDANERDPSAVQCAQSVMVVHDGDDCRRHVPDDASDENFDDGETDDLVFHFVPPCLVNGFVVRSCG